MHDVMVFWLWEQGVAKLWLTTDPCTSAQRFYESAGRSLAGPASNGQLLFERLIVLLSSLTLLSE
jgi:hypothetical protein